MQSKIQVLAVAKADTQERRAERTVASVGDIPVGYICELTALHRLLRDVDSLPLHAHKRAVVRDWIEEHVRTLGREAEAARNKTPNV